MRIVKRIPTLELILDMSHQESERRKMEDMEKINISSKPVIPETNNLVPLLEQIPNTKVFCLVLKELAEKVLTLSFGIFVMANIPTE